MSNNHNNIGLVASLFRYPVKSMMGEELNATDITQRGLLGDRVYAVVDSSDGKVGSAKNPRKWPNLFDFRAAYAEPPQTGTELPAVRVTLPDGRLVLGGRPDPDAALSAAAGRAVTLRGTPPAAPVLEEYWPDLEPLPHRDAVTDEKLPAGTFFDLAPVPLVTTATLDRLRALYPAGRFEVRRFRPNVVVATRP